MAFLGKVGSMITRGATKHTGGDLSMSNPVIFQAVRWISSKVFVGGLSYGTNEDGLKQAFSQYGQVIDAKVVFDRETNRSRGFGFVTYTSSEEASSAIQALDGQDLDGRRVRVSYATEKSRPSFGGGGSYGGWGSGGGGYGGGYGAEGGGYAGGGGSYGAGGDGYMTGGGGYGAGDNYSSSGGGGDGYGSTGSVDYGGGNYGGSSFNFTDITSGGNNNDNFSTSSAGDTNFGHDPDLGKNI